MYCYDMISFTLIYLDYVNTSPDFLFLSTYYASNLAFFTAVYFASVFVVVVQSGQKLF